MRPAAIPVHAFVGVGDDGRLVSPRPVRPLGWRARHREEGLCANDQLAGDTSLFIDEIACRRAGGLVPLGYLVRLLQKHGRPDIVCLHYLTIRQAIACSDQDRDGTTVSPVHRKRGDVRRHLGAVAAAGVEEDE